MSLGLGVTVFMFVVTYVPQAAVLTIFNGPLAFVTTVLLVLSESSTIFNVLSKNFLIDDALIDTFDGTLMSRNMTTLVAKERAVKSGSDPIAKLGKLAAKPFAKFAPSAIIRYFMYLPLNFIPIIGTVMFVILQGRKFGPAAHARYFQLKQMNKKEKDQFVERRKAAYARYAPLPPYALQRIHTNRAPQFRCPRRHARNGPHRRHPLLLHQHSRRCPVGRRHGNARRERPEDHGAGAARPGRRGAARAVGLVPVQPLRGARGALQIPVEAAVCARAAAGLAVCARVERRRK
jgi:hypothetical protein